ncbi:MAG TPA: hypothetical protein VNZ53_03370 [Steroidobacteraceae bacterium]|nr:hypothetical protein [Steroidobacteraceae bacterium]
MTSLDNVFEFLEIIAKKNFLNDNTVQARRTACNKLFELLEPDERTVEHVRDNLDSLKSRFSNKYKDVSGATVEEYGRRVRQVLDDYTAWSTDRAAWERSIAAKQSAKPARDDEKKPRAEKPKPSTNGSGDSSSTTTASFPFPGGRRVKIELPAEGLSMVEIKRLGFYLLPYANDWSPDAMPAQQRVEDMSDR